MILLLAIIFLCTPLPFPLRAVAIRPVRYEIAYLNVEIAHFSKSRKKLDESSQRSNNTFKQKYLYNYDYYRSGGPIFFHCGGQEPVEVAAARIVSKSLK